MVSRELSCGRLGKGGGGFLGTGYDRFVVCASHCHWQCPLLAFTPGICLFDDMTRRPRGSRASGNGNRCRLSYQSIRDLQMWRKLASTEIDGRPIRPPPTNGILHTDAVDVGFDGTLDETLDSGRTKGYGNGNTEQSTFRSKNSRRFVWCSWEC
jgi:hypothetical protein